MGLIGQQQGNEYLTFNEDFRGSTVALTNSTAQIIERFQYSPYGLLMSGEASTTPFLFNGMYGVMTDASGLYYMRARYYHPEIRRFVNQDVLLGFVSEGQTLNRYAYVTGRPVSYMDPFGLSEQDVQKIIITFRKTVDKMTKSGQRYPLPSLNNILSSLYIVSGGFIGKPYLGCIAQEIVIEEALRQNAYDDIWRFEPRYGYRPLPHQWGMAISNNPKDPRIKFDPWYNKLTLYYVGGPE